MEEKGWIPDEKAKGGYIWGELEYYCPMGCKFKGTKKQIEEHMVEKHHAEPLW